MPETIVCLDGHTLNPGDLSWTPFERIGSFNVYDRSDVLQVVERVGSATCVLTNKTLVSAEAIASLPKVKYIGVLATGYNVVDVEAATRHDKVVTNVPTYGTDTVAQHATALILELARHVYVHHLAVTRGQWSLCSDFCFSLAPITELTGMTLGILGLGRIGRTLARIGAAMGMKLIAHDVFWPTSEQLVGLEIESLPLDDVFSRADVVSLHCPLTDQTHHLVDAERLRKMKPTALLINTSRGPLVDGQALADALRGGTIAGAALDVLEVEPPPADNPLIGAPNCIITPHIAWYATAARQRIIDTAADNLTAFIAGKTINRVK